MSEPMTLERLRAALCWDTHKPPKALTVPVVHPRVKKMARQLRKYGKLKEARLLLGSHASDWVMSDEDAQKWRDSFKKAVQACPRCSKRSDIDLLIYGFQGELELNSLSAKLDQ